jgi:proline iminopeptidase
MFIRSRNQSEVSIAARWAGAVSVILALALLMTVSALAAQQESGKVFEAGGASIYYEVRGGGSGLPLFVVNGGPGFDHSYLHCSTVWDEIAKARPVVFYDQRGNGRSGQLKQGQACGLAEQIADLEALRGHLKYDKVDLLGHSWGGFLVMAYSARYAAHVSRLLILDSAAPRWQDTEFLFRYIFPETVGRQDAQAFAQELGDDQATAVSIKEYLSMLFYSPAKRDAFLAGAGSYSHRRAVNLAVTNDLRRFDLNPELPKFKMPTLVMTGRYDINVAPSTAYRIHLAIPGSKFAVFEKSGHLPFYEEPEEFLKVVQGFLDAE